jgi:hypothetical protein
MARHQGQKLNFHRSDSGRVVRARPIDEEWQHTALPCREGVRQGPFQPRPVRSVTTARTRGSKIDPIHPRLLNEPVQVRALGRPGNKTWRGDAVQPKECRSIGPAGCRIGTDYLEVAGRSYRQNGVGGAPLGMAAAWQHANPKAVLYECYALREHGGGEDEVIQLSRKPSHRNTQIGLNLSTSCVHSSSSRGLRARKLIPTVPNFAALDACGAPANTSARQVISKSTNPAATTVAWSSASSRAPAIHPFQRSMFRLALSGTVRSTRMSPI